MQRNESELLFEKFCRENSIPYERVEEGEDKTPDYRILFGAYLVITEVKQVNANDSDTELLKRARRNRAAAGWQESARRVRSKINDAAKQLRAGSQGRYPALLVLYDNIPTGSIDDDDIKTAMYGNERITVATSERRGFESSMIGDLGFGADRSFTPNDNTTFSAVALLFDLAGTQCLSIFHNAYAVHPIDPSWLRRESVRHFALGPKMKDAFPVWVEM